MAQPKNQYADLIDEKGLIRADRANDILVEVCSGKHIFASGTQIYASRSATMHEQERGRIIYVRAFKEAVSKNIMTRAQMEVVAVENGLFEQEVLEEKQNLEREFQRTLKNRQKTTDASQKVDYDLDLEKMRKRLIEIDNDEHQVFCHCAESIADYARTSYFVSCCTFGGDLLEELVWPDLKSFQACNNRVMVYDARRAYTRVSLGLPSNVIRALARTPEWKGRWRAAKDTQTSAFDGTSNNWDRNKLELVHWSEFFDSVAQHPDAPSEEIIADENSLQDWMNRQIQKREMAKAQNASASGGQMWTDGSGKKSPMVTIGNKNISVRQPFKMPSSRR